MAGDTQYDVTALKANIVRCKGNIETFEQAIQKERDTIKELWHMIDVIAEQRDREK